MSLIKPASEEEWLNLRKKYITATEASCLLGLNPWRSANQMAQEKNDPTSFEGNAYTIIGQLLEEVVVDLTNIVLNKDFKLYEGRNFFCDDELGLGATPDACDDTSILECKTTRPVNLVRYCGAAPDYYIIQLLVQLMLDKSKKDGYLSIMGTDLTQTSPELRAPLIIYHIKKSPGITKLINQEVERFWKCQEEGKMFRVASDVKRKSKLLCRLCSRRIV